MGKKGDIKICKKTEKGRERIKGWRKREVGRMEEAEDMTRLGE